MTVSAAVDATIMNPASKNPFGTAEHPQSMRAYLRTLSERGAVQVVHSATTTEFEIAAHLALVGAGPALVFDNIPGHALRVVGNLLPSRERIAVGLATTPQALQEKLVRAIRSPLPGEWIDQALCQEVAVDRPDLDALPIPRFFEHETGPYLTAGAIVARNPDTGGANLSYARLKPLGGNRAMIGIAPNHHLAVYARGAAARRARLPIAVTLGNHPAVAIAAALYLGLDEDEMGVAGALFGQPVALARCGHAALGVPAHCEIVLEGTLDPAARVGEGPVSEFHGMYESYGEGYVVEFSRLTRRADAMLQVIQPGYFPEHVWIGGEAIAAGLAVRVARELDNVSEVAITPGGAGRMHAVIALSAPRPGDARKAMAAAWDAVNLVKLVTVVDDDVDPWDAVRVEQALATRMRADRDLVVMPAAKTDRSDPLEDGGTIAKLGIDATRKTGDRDDWRSAEPPAHVLDRIRHRLASGD
jgi:4-hydroxy-3-polyprenylbenzoate decarboxylase